MTMPASSSRRGARSPAAKEKITVNIGESVNRIAA
jgi:hypothetical protein